MQHKITLVSIERVSGHSELTRFTQGTNGIYLLWEKHRYHFLFWIYILTGEFVSAASIQGKHLIALNNAGFYDFMQPNKVGKDSE